MSNFWPQISRTEMFEDTYGWTIYGGLQSWS